ncbi:transposase [Elysia marginata]|uniref:Transposase n=1 Tax=Elysia marginata TaxID=1093978 RepID=A0AAV4EBF0_9GAST|nr:transposase [Elysia marginata]
MRETPSRVRVVWFLSSGDVSNVNKFQVILTSDQGKELLNSKLRTDQRSIALYPLSPDQMYTVTLKALDSQGNVLEETGYDLQARSDDGGPHKARATTQSLRDLGIQVLPHPAYSPDLALCDFWLFPILKDRLAGRKFDRIQDLTKTVNSELRKVR